MTKVRKRLFLYGLIAVFLLSIFGSAMAEPAENRAAPDAEQQINSVFKDVTADDSNIILGDASEGSLPSTPFGSRCLWYGKTNSTNPYEVGNFLKEQVAYDQPMEGGHSVSPHRDYAVSPVITIPGATNREYILSFSSWWEIEAVNPYSFDMMNVYIVDGEKSILLDTINPKYSYLQDVTYQNNAPLAFTSGGYNTPGVWKTYQYNLTEYMGKSIKLKFEFNTGDTNYNAFRGWFIDQLKLTQMVSKPGNVSGKVLDYTAGSAGNGIQNISVQLLNKDYEVVATTLSSTDGSYSFSGIAPGNYCVSVESPLGYDNYSQLIKVTVMPGQTTAGNDFYLRALTPSITYVSTPYYCEYSGKDQQIEVTIFTIAIAEGTEINVQLLNEDKQAVVGVSSVSAIVGSDNAAMTNLTIPQNTPCGYYYIRASINGVDPYDQSFVITDGWTAIGNSLTAAADSGLGLIVGTTNANLAFTDGNGYAKVYTNTLEGSTNWTLMGDALNTNGALVDLSIWNGAALAAYRNESGVPTVASFVYDVGPWTTLTGGTVPTGTADSLSLDVGGVDQLPYLAYKNSGSIYTYAYGPGGWQPMASEFSGASPSGTLSINAASGKPYLAYLNDSNKVTVRVYVYGNWQTISGSGWTGAGSLALTTDGENLYIAYSEQTAERGLVMKGRYKETGWDWEGPLYFSDNKIDNISLAWYGDHLYVAYSDEDQNGKLVVKYLDGTDWIPIEIEGWGQDSVAETRIRVTSNGIYVLYEVGSGYVTLLRHNLPVIS